MKKERFKITTSVGLLLFREQDGEKQIALQRRTNTGFMDGMYDAVVSGHLEKNESLSEALAREATEEANLMIDENDLELAFLFHDVEEEYLNIYFTCKKYTGEPTIMEPDKCDDMQWFNINKLPENTILKLKGVIESVSKKINYDDACFKRKIT